jgi:hypothetical protein
VEVKRKAKEAYAQFRVNPRHPSLRFKKIHSTMPIHSVRINRDYRAVGVMKAEGIVWFWVGSHSAYDSLLKQMRG